VKKPVLRTRPAKHRGAKHAESRERKGENGVFVHESSYVDKGAQIGAGTKIWHFCHIMPGAIIGELCNLGQNVVVMNAVRIGNNVKVQNNVSIYEGVELENDVFCGPSMVFTNVINPRSHVSRKSEYRKTLVRRGTTIGANATVVCGVTLGEFSFIGAGAVVTKDVRAYALVVGVPARRVGWMCQCGERLPDTGAHAKATTWTCRACGSSYERSGDGIRPASSSTRTK
jgi:UDP-2-acetamido-3-amino-2,3-dideoxy-glucuronate N-acetyltransferase